VKEEAADAIPENVEEVKRKEIKHDVVPEDQVKEKAIDEGKAKKWKDHPTNCDTDIYT